MATQAQIAADRRTTFRLPLVMPGANRELLGSPGSGKGRLGPPLL